MSSGNSIRLKLEWLQQTSFQNFLIPGIVLFLLVGVGNTVGIWVTFRKKNKFALIGLVFGLILMVRIISQVTWIGYKGFLQPLYFASGFLQAITGMVIIRLSMNNDSD